MVCDLVSLKTEFGSLYSESCPQGFMSLAQQQTLMNSLGTTAATAEMMKRRATPTHGSGRPRSKTMGDAPLNSSPDAQKVLELGASRIGSKEYPRNSMNPARAESRTKYTIEPKSCLKLNLSVNLIWDFPL